AVGARGFRRAYAAVGARGFRRAYAAVGARGFSRVYTRLEREASAERQERDRDERLCGRVLERCAGPPIVDGVRAVAEARQLREERVGGRAGGALKLRRVHLGQDDGAIA